MQGIYRIINYHQHLQALVLMPLKYAVDLQGNLKSHQVLQVLVMVYFQDAADL